MQGSEQVFWLSPNGAKGHDSFETSGPSRVTVKRIKDRCVLVLVEALPAKPVEPVKSGLRIREAG